MKKILTLILTTTLFLINTGAQKTNALEWYEEQAPASAGAGADAETEDEISIDDQLLDEEAEQDKVLLQPMSLEPPSSISIFSQFLDHDIIKIEVTAKGMETPVLGIAFHLKFDPTLLAFLKYEPGTFLELGGDPFYIVQNKMSESKDELGQIYFGSTLRRNDNFPVGEGSIANFYFQELDAENTKYEFKFEAVSVSTLDITRQDIDKIQFIDAIFDKNEEVAKAQTQETLDPALASVINANEGFFERNFAWIATAIGMILILLILYFYEKKA